MEPGIFSRQFCMGNRKHCKSFGFLLHVLFVFSIFVRNESAARIFVCECVLSSLSRVHVALSLLLNSFWCRQLYSIASEISFTNRRYGRFQLIVQPSDNAGVTHPYLSCVFTNDLNDSSAVCLEIRQMNNNNNIHKYPNRFSERTSCLNVISKFNTDYSIHTD